MFFPIVLLSVAVSMDGFSAGLAYGMRSLKIPFVSLIIIALSSAGAMMISMYAGSTITNYLPAEFVPKLGGGILALLGIWVILIALIAEKKDKPSEENAKKKNKSLWQNPECADLDESGSISLLEAVLLGSILATDAFAAGLGASFMGLSPILTGLCVGLSKLTLVSLGLQLGYRSVDFITSKTASLVAGGILICMGILSIIT